MAKVFASFILGYGVRNFCARCQKAITADNALVLQNKLGSYYATGLCCDESDDEGNAWRCFCRPCFDAVSKQKPEAVFAQYPASRFEEV